MESKYILIQTLILSTLFFPLNSIVAYSEPVTGNLRGSQTGIIIHPDIYDSVPAGLFENNLYRLWWATGNNGDTIAYAVSNSPAGPWHDLDSSVPHSFRYVFHPSRMNEKFDGLHAADPTVIKVDGVYYMYYGGGPVMNTAPFVTAIGVAKSIDGIVWERLNNGNPIILPAMKTILNVERTGSSGGMVQLYRLQYGDTEFLTADENGKSVLLSSGWTPVENLFAGAILDSAHILTGAAAWYRVYDVPKQTHFYTYDEQILQTAIQNGAVNEGVAGYVFPSDRGVLPEAYGTVPLYEAFSPDKTKYLYTLYQEEFTARISQGWQYRLNGIAAYIYKSLPYGAGQPTVTYANGMFYLLFTDTTGYDTNPTDRLGSQYVIRSKDPLFLTGVERFTGAGFTPASTPSDYTQTKLFVGVSVDAAFIPQHNQFMVLAAREPHQKQVIFYNVDFQKITEGTIPDQSLPDGYSYQDGQTMFTGPQRDAIMKNSNTLSLDFVGAVGPPVDNYFNHTAANLWDLYWRGADMTIPVIKPGDANGDNLVDGRDYVIWAGNYNKNVTGPAAGDFDNNSMVDGRDYVIWMGNYGM